MSATRERSGIRRAHARVRERTTAKHPASADGSTIRIESRSRWDAVALAHDLGGYHWHLVQTGLNEWHVCLRSDGQTRELSEDLVRRLQRWLDERNLPAARVQLPGGHCVLVGRAEERPSAHGL